MQSQNVEDSSNVPSNSGENSGSASAQKPKKEATIVERARIKLVGPKIRIEPFDHKKIGQLWGQFVPGMHTIAGRTNAQDSYGVCFSSTGNDPASESNDAEHFDYMAAVPVVEFSDEHANLSRIEIPAGRFAQFTHRGPVEKLPETFAAVQGQLQVEGIQINNALVLELYDARFSPSNPDSELDLLFPLA